MEGNVIRVSSDSGRSTLELHQLLQSGQCRRGSNFVIFPAPKLESSHSRDMIGFLPVDVGTAAIPVLEICDLPAP